VRNTKDSKLDFEISAQLIRPTTRDEIKMIESNSTQERGTQALFRSSCGGRLCVFALVVSRSRCVAFCVVGCRQKSKSQIEIPKKRDDGGGVTKTTIRHHVNKCLQVCRIYVRACEPASLLVLIF
jgi:hypothetical protein